MRNSSKASGQARLASSYCRIMGVGADKFVISPYSKRVTIGAKPLTIDPQAWETPPHCIYRRLRYYR